MTRLTRPVRRLVTTHTGTALVATLTEHGIEFREPRRRTAYLLPYGPAFVRAADLFAQAEKRRKAEERKLRQGGR